MRLRSSFATFLCLRRGVSTGEEIVIPYPLTFLCLRRGVSIILCHIAFGATFSLPTQRCFSGYCSGGERRELFSAYAEVFLKSPKISLRVHSFLCLRRGVSGGNGCVRDGSNFSLPTQRCFRYATRSLPFFHLFSAYAEVFPTHTDQRHADRSFSLPTQRCFSDSAASCFRRHLFSAYAVVFLG